MTPDPITAAADVLAAHIDIGREGQCRCGWRQRASGATYLHEHITHVAQALHDAGLRAGDDAVRAAKAEALREAADEWTQGKWSDVMLPKPKPPAVPVIAYSNRMGDWLRARAAALSEGSDRD